MVEVGAKQVEKEREVVTEMERLIAIVKRLSDEVQHIGGRIESVLSQAPAPVLENQENKQDSVEITSTLAVKVRDIVNMIRTDVNLLNDYSCRVEL